MVESEIFISSMLSCDSRKRKLDTEVAKTEQVIGRRLALYSRTTNIFYCCNVVTEL